MKLNFYGDTAEIEKGVALLAKRLDYELAPGGTEVFVSKRDGGLSVAARGNKAEIYYSEKIHFFRALGILCEHFGKDFSVSEKPEFDKNGILFDASRNSVMKVPAIKDFIEIMAVMGLNLFIMYTEDTYEVPGFPYFGYMRGRYSFDEIHECAQYADIFGIEMMPCIQTLGHLAKVLKWDNGIDIKDTDLVLNVGSEDTYAFIRDMLKAATAPYISKRVHIGLDEAFDMGHGRYLIDHEYADHSILMPQHLERVKAVCDDLGLEIMMWSDMFFRAASGGGYFVPDVEFTDEFKKSVPDDVGLVYWDYYNTDENFYSNMIKKHRELSENTIFAGGIWIWGEMTANYKAVFSKSVPALNACIKNGVKEVIATIWGDCGAQANVYEALLGMQLYAEMGYGEGSDYTHLSKRFAACTGENADAFMYLTMLDDLGQSGFGYNFYGDGNPSEYLLWQNILMGMLDSHIDIDNISQLYAQRAQMYRQYARDSKNYADIFEYSYRLADVLAIKSDLGVKIKKAYDANDAATLHDICTNVFPELKSRVELFKEVYRRLWLFSYKPFGYEIIDTRLGGVLAGIDTARYRLEQYLSGKADKLEELEQERLPYKALGYDYRDGLALRTRCYTSYASAGYYSLGNTDL